VKYNKTAKGSKGVVVIVVWFWDGGGVRWSVTESGPDMIGGYTAKSLIFFSLKKEIK